MQEEQSQPTVAGNDEISLVDLLKVLHKRKRFIAFATLACTFVAVGVSLLLPRVYEVTAIVSPALGENLIVTPLEIKEAIHGGVYDNDLTSKLQLAEKELPKITVSVIEKTSFVKISVRTDDPEAAVSLENELISLLSREQSMKLRVELQQIDNLLKLHSINLQTKKKQLNL